ncbi:DnaJ-like protein subfamily C member 7 [Trichoplax sp. H2]|nr:DnaJ-like protein subfamily C member 7 [Trichoplax sp. H2]|eukprot:RDD37058.1 DnaJ-like protein subfamily C member 7 [Trichoplax sp. H2]
MRSAAPRPSPGWVPVRRSCLAFFPKRATLIQSRFLRPSFISPFHWTTTKGKNQIIMEKMDVAIDENGDNSANGHLTSDNASKSDTIFARGVHNLAFFPKRATLIYSRFLRPSFISPFHWTTTKGKNQVIMEKMDVAIDENGDNSALAEEKKTLGNEAYKKGDYKEACKFYTEAIELKSNNPNYLCNRAAALMMLNRHNEALNDAVRAIQFDDNYVKGHLRVAKCYMNLGKFDLALQSFAKVRSLDPANKQVKHEIQNATSLKLYFENATKHMDKEDYRQVIYWIDKALQISPSCLQFKFLKVEALIKRGIFSEASSIVNDVLRMNDMNADALYLRGLCLYYQDYAEKAKNHFMRVLKADPDHKRSKDSLKLIKRLISAKEAGNEAFKKGKYEEAYNSYTQALEIDPYNKYINSKLYCNRATTHAKLNRAEAAIADCSEAIKLDDSYVKAYLRRAKCYMDTEQYEEAVRDYEKVLQLDTSQEHKRLVKDAKLELKKSKRKNYYKILNVSKNATDDEIKKAYRKEALKHHPDRHASATEEERKKEELLFKEVGEAYAVLSDKQKRHRYDSGQDLEDSSFGADINPNDIFQMFFGGGGGGNPFGGGSRFRNSGGHDDGYPGFTFTFG